jgi:hypothetical protein
VLAVLCASLGLGAVAYLLQGVTGTVEALQLRSNVSDELSRVVPAAVAAVSEDRDRQRRRTPELGKPRHSWMVLECDVVARQDGWRAGSHDQVCVVRAVDAHSMARGSASAERCRSVGRCVHFLRRSQVLRPGVHLLEGSVPKRLERGTPWLLVTSRAPALKVELGCSPWTPVICRAPFAEPVMQ